MVGNELGDDFKDYITKRYGVEKFRSRIVFSLGIKVKKIALN